MGKVLRVTMPDATVWDINAEIIADARAKYYAELDVKRGDADDFDVAFKEEFEFAMDDDSELIEYAGGNMDWDDLQPYATRVMVPHQGANYRRAYPDADLEVVEV